MSEQTATHTARTKNGRGDFFAVDRRVWHLVCGLSMNAAVAYLVMARGSGGDNRTTKWSINAIESYTGISRSRAQNAVRALEKAGALRRDPASAASRPKYKLLPAHEIRTCEGFPPDPLPSLDARVYAALGDEWSFVPNNTLKRDLWGTSSPRPVAERLVRSGHAEEHPDGGQFRAIRYDAEAAARPDWIWLPNALIDGAADEVPPVELIRQTGSAITLRLLVNLYRAHTLDEDGGIHFRQIWQPYVRHKVGECGPLIVWGFVPTSDTVKPTASFAIPHYNGKSREAGSKEFWDCWDCLHGLGLVEFVAHLLDADSDEGEILYPVARRGTGLNIERKLRIAATEKARTLITPGQKAWAEKQGIMMLAPVPRHIKGVQMMGIARLRYQPRTSRTQAFMAQEVKWAETLRWLRNDERSDAFATSR